MFKPSNRSDIETFRALDNLQAVNEKIAQGADIIRLEAGQPCFGAPQAVLDYAHEILSADPRQGYTDALGMVPLRERIARYYKDHYGVEVSAANIAITVGSSAGFIMAFLAAFDAGDTIALCTPTYAAYKNILKSLDLKIVEIPTSAETNFQPTVEVLKNAPQTFDGIIINSPSNPTGTIIDESEFNAICEWCTSQGVRLISDEAYHNISYDHRAETALKFTKNAIVLNTFSKYFAMTGWRLGWVVTPPDLTPAMKKLCESLFVSAPTLSQHAALKVFDHLDDLDAYVAHYKKNRDILMDGLPKAGLTKLSACDGAFYIYADISEYADNSEEFCMRMVEEAGVSATSGLDFDTARGHHFIRISYAGTPEDMVEACNRLESWLLRFSNTKKQQHAG